MDENACRNVHALSHRLVKRVAETEPLTLGLTLGSIADAKTLVDKVEDMRAIPKETHY